MPLLATIPFLLSLHASTAKAAANVTHYPPLSTHLNDLNFALNGEGAPGIYNSSHTPDSAYGVYNWCNMPHVRAREYKKPPEEYTLEYVEVIHRHHKRTPYGSNILYEEDIPWSCEGSGPVTYLRTTQGVGKDPTIIQWQASRNPQNPFANLVNPGFVGSTCQFPQITPEGHEDCYTHGKDLRSVYAPLLNLSTTIDPRIVQIRVTTNTITSQVSSGVLRGLFPSSPIASVLIQSAAFDSLEPTYPCKHADDIKTGYTTGDEGGVWNEHLEKAQSVYAELDEISGVGKDGWEGDGGWHISFDHYYDNFSAKQCHAKPLPCNLNDTSLCVTQEQADTVYRLGNWEYSYLYRDAPQTALYAALHYGAFFLELKSHLKDKAEGKSEVRYFHNVAHDGSISSALGFLQVDKMVWPGMGSEIIFELYSKRNTSQYFIRVLWSGQPMSTSTPLGKLDLIPLEEFIGYIDSMVGGPDELVAGCAADS